MGIIQETIKIAVVMLASYGLALLTAMYTYYETYNQQKVIRYVHVTYTIICALYLVKTPVYAMLSLLALSPKITPVVQAAVYTTPQGLIMVPLSFTATTLWHLNKHETRRKNKHE